MSGLPSQRKVNPEKVLRRLKIALEFKVMLRALLLSCLISLGWAQSFSPPRLPGGHPDMQGVWRAAILSPAFDIQAHEGTFQSPAGPSVIIDPPDGKLPYLPEATKRAKVNWEERDRDPVGYCHPHGVPRELVPPFPLEIVQDGDYFVLLSETAHDVRIIPLDGRPHRKNYWAWEGDARGRWEGDTLIVDVTGFNGKKLAGPGGQLCGRKRTCGRAIYHDRPG